MIKPIKNKEKPLNDHLDEMIVILDEDFISHPGGTELVVGLQKTFKNIRLYRLPVKDSILFKRFELSEGDSLGEVPPSNIKMKITDENIVMVRLKAQFLIETINQKISRDYFERIQTVYKNMKVICIIEGLNTYFRKCRNEVNREFIDSVQTFENPDQYIEKRKPKNSPNLIPISKVIIDNFLVELQVELQLHVILTENTTATLESISSLMKAIATRPYK